MVELDVAAVVPLSVTRRARLDLDRAARELDAEQIDWLGTAVPRAEGVEQRAFHCDMRLPMRTAGREVDFHKAALVSLGPVRAGDGEVRLDISWRATGLTPLFPVFAGQMTANADGISLSGWYAPPGGRLGAALDRLLLRIASRRTAEWLVELVASHLGSSAATGTEQQEDPEADD